MIAAVFVLAAWFFGFLVAAGVFALKSRFTSSTISTYHIGKNTSSK